MTINVLTNQFEIEYDEARECLCIWTPGVKSRGLRPIEITKKGLGELPFAEAAEFVGEKILLLIPAMREQFKDYLWTDDGNTPPKKT
jgi:hypothetical protein